MNKKILFLILLSVIFVPLITTATTVGGVVSTVASNLTGLGAGLATIGFVVAGIMYLTAAGNPGKMAIAKGAIVAVVIGIIIILLSTTAKDFIQNFFGLQ